MYTVVRLLLQFVHIASVGLGTPAQKGKFAISHEGLHNPHAAATVDRQRCLGPSVRAPFSQPSVLSLLKIFTTPFSA